MNTFLFSDTFSDIIKGVLVDCYMNFTKNKTESGDNLLLVSIILCFMLKTSLNQNIHSRFYKTVELIFGINKDLANNSVMTTLAFLKKKLDNCVFSSIVDYLMELSKIPNNVFSYLPENLSDMVNKSKDCRDLALKNLQKTYQETSKYKEESNGDQKDLTEELNSCDKETTE
ncbi:hypothetical protein RF11_02787 [Thelohanellus kitauei]|uniref:Uncharacterized protein n=1 Tax=Thelohanellus kitauei TaxID=669202 RepID=A0A0C2JKD7_THEKT|nr:hypothetical protein RF11_02787 [Thelohanellus kitauei]